MAIAQRLKLSLRASQRGIVAEAGVALAVAGGLAGVVVVEVAIAIAIAVAVPVAVPVATVGNARVHEALARRFFAAAHHHSERRAHPHSRREPHRASLSASCAERQHTCRAALPRKRFAWHLNRSAV
jgi:hypothetical protein